MAGSTNNQSNIGAFIATTNVWDVQSVQSSDIDPKLKELFVRLYQNINNISIILNMKDTGFYTNEAFLTGQQYFPNPIGQTQDYRQVLRATIDFGALPNAAAKAVAHNIVVTNDFLFTRIYGCATNPSTSYIPLPFASTTLNENIKLEVDGTNVTITTGINRTAYTSCYVVLEYLIF